MFRVVALPAPTEREKSQIYIQRYIPHLPAAGEVVIFDRSWYNRAGVERIMGFCPEKKQFAFLDVPAVGTSGGSERDYPGQVLVRGQSGGTDPPFLARINDGRKIWKLSPMDLESHRRWYDYSRARDDMLLATDTPFAPWYIVNADDKSARA